MAQGAGNVLGRNADVAELRLADRHGAWHVVINALFLTVSAGGKHSRSLTGSGASAGRDDDGGGGGAGAPLRRSSRIKSKAAETGPSGCSAGNAGRSHCVG